MAIKVNRKGVTHARKLIEAGKVNKTSSWSFDASDSDKLLGDNNWSSYAKWFLGQDTEAPEDTKGRYKFPFGKNGKVYRRAIIAAKQRASQQGYDDIFAAASNLLDLIDGKDKKKEAPGDTRDSPQLNTMMKHVFPLNVRGILDDENKIVEISISSEMLVRKWFGNEILLHTKDAVDLSPLKEVGSILENHDPSKRVAKPLKLWVDEEDRRVRGIIQFGSTPNSTRAYEEVKQGLLRGVSAGYQYREIEKIEEGEEKLGFRGPAWLVTRWALIEASLTPIPADPSVGVGRATTADNLNDKGDDNMDKDKKKEKREEIQTPSPPELTDEEIKKAREEAEKEARKRASEIIDLCSKHGMNEHAREWIEKGLTLDEVRAEILERLEARKDNKPAGMPYGAVDVVIEDRDKFRSAAIDGLLIRQGIKDPGDQVAPGATDFAGMSLLDIARECLRRNGIFVRSKDKVKIATRALSTSDFPVLLGGTANVIMLEGYQAASETWREWCATGNLPDFNIHTLARAGELDDLDEIPEGAPYSYSNLKEASENVQLATYGKLFAVTRQMIINDNLGMIADLARSRGEEAARKVGDIVYAVLTSNPTMGDGKALFHSAHGNIGTPGAPSEVTIAEAIKLMKLQKDIRGKRRLNIRAQYFIAPAALEGSAEIFFTSNMFTGGVGKEASTRTNPYAGNRFTRIYDARLDDAGGNSWYVAGPKGKTVKVFFLEGQAEPYLDTREGWKVDGVEYKVRIDAAAKAVDWRALVKTNLS